LKIESRHNKKQMTAELIVIVLIIGLAAGMLSGLVGVGGGIIMVPALVWFLNYTQHQAQGTSLGVLTFPVILLAFLKYYKDCNEIDQPIDFKVIALLGVGFIAGSYFGSSIALKIDEKLLKKIFAIILFYSAFKMLEWDAAVVKWVKGVF
jgi:uncharacterized membrane protein YfcA